MTWVWSDDLLRRFAAAGTVVPDGAARWIATPVALRVRPDQDEADLARLLDLEGESSTDPIQARTMSPRMMPCACETGSIEQVERGVAG